MAIRDSMRTTSAEYLLPDEVGQAIFAASTAPVGGIWPVVGLNRVVAVTYQRILVLSVKRAGSKRPALGVVAELPRTTELGPIAALKRCAYTRSRRWIAQLVAESGDGFRN
jgi:hypothetical protein